MTALEEILLIAWPILLAVLAAGAVVFIKTTRRRQGTIDPSMTAAVPVRPLSAADARKMQRRYLYVAAAVFGALLLTALFVAGAA